jgi:hypothetical protein
VNNFGIITISHGRPEILRLWCAGMHRLHKDLGWFPVVVAGDEEHGVICDEYNIFHIPMINEPASAKWNEAMEAMMTSCVEYSMIIGSDNLISNDLLKNLITKMNEGYDMIGIKKIYFYCAEGLFRGRARVVESKQFLGVCKTLHRRVIERTGKIWTRERSWGMDADCSRNISPYVHTTAVAEGICFDIKTSESLNKYAYWEGKKATPNYTPNSCDPKLLWDIMGEEEKLILKNYEND